MAVRARNAATPWVVFASSAGVAALLVACLLSESGANFANAQPAPAGDPDWVAQMLQTTDSVGAETDAQPAPADLGWVEQLMPNSDWSAQDASAQGPPAEIPPAQGEPPADDPDSDDQDEEDDSRPEFAGEIDPEDSEGQAEPDWEAQMQSILQQVANRTFLSSFGQIFASFCEFLTALNRSEPRPAFFTPFPRGGAWLGGADAVDPPAGSDSFPSPPASLFIGHWCHLTQCPTWHLIAHFNPFISPSPLPLSLFLPPPVQSEQELPHSESNCSYTSHSYPFCQLFPILPPPVQSEQLYIDQDATILIPTNVGYWRYETQWDTLTRKQKRRLLRYHILKGRYTTQQLLDAAPLTLFPTFNQNLPVNKTLKPNEVYFQSVPPTRFVSPLSVPNAGLTDNIAAHGVTMVLIPPNLN
ncbi:unnamed protein product [Closterium sp. NIES-65]|nr:unnamed protein product [Closterium sp. NIES-65]